MVKRTRFGEIILFAKELGCEKIGLAFCIGLSEEAKVIDEILSKHFEVVSVCCKVCGIDKKDFELQQISSERQEVMCNPAGQAQLLNNAETQLNVICGAFVFGHDAIFAKGLRCSCNNAYCQGSRIGPQSSGGYLQSIY